MKRKKPKQDIHVIPDRLFCVFTRDSLLPWHITRARAQAEVLARAMNRATKAYKCHVQEYASVRGGAK